MKKFGNNHGSGTFGVLLLIGIIGLAIYGGIFVVNKITFSRDVGGHLKRAADANSITLASSELKIALGGIDARGYCPEVKRVTTPEELPQDCYTSAIYNTPDEDVAFWRYNIQTAYKELQALPADTDTLTKTNALMKLRETLVDHGEAGTKITLPDGISRYPHNLGLGLLFTLSGILALIGGLGIKVNP